MDFEIRRELLESMFKVVEENVHYYKTDFVCYDIPQIVERKNNFKKAYWFVRECGTDLKFIMTKNIDEYDTELISLMARANKKAYSFTNNSAELVEEDIEALRNLKRRK